MTGGGFGYCSGNEAPGFGMRGSHAGRGAGWGQGGRGAGGGRGHRHMYYATGLPGRQRAGAGRGARFGTGAWGAPDLLDDVSEMRSEAQRLEDAAARLRERADALGQNEERTD